MSLYLIRSPHSPTRHIPHMRLYIGARPQVPHPCTPTHWVEVMEGHLNSVYVDADVASTH